MYTNSWVHFHIIVNNVNKINHYIALPYSNVTCAPAISSDA